MPLNYLSSALQCIVSDRLRDAVCRTKCRSDFVWYPDNTAPNKTTTLPLWCSVRQGAIAARGILHDLALFIRVQDCAFRNLCHTMRGGGSLQTLRSRGKK